MSQSSLNTLNNPLISSQQQQNEIYIKISQPYNCKSTISVLKYQWLIFMTLSLLFLSTLTVQHSNKQSLSSSSSLSSSLSSSSSTPNLKVLLYCILFLFQQTLKQSTKLLQLSDPLCLSFPRKFLKHITFLTQLNMIYLIFRILIQTHNIYSFLLFLHYSIKSMINFDKDNKKNYEIHLIDNQEAQNLLWKISTPFLLFMFTMLINDNKKVDISFVQLLLVGFNLVLTVEVKMLLINKQCHIFGWEKHVYQDNNHLIFNKQHAIKKIIFAISAAVAIQNLFFILPKMNQYTSFTMFHTLILGAYTLYLKRKQNNIQI